MYLMFCGVQFATVYEPVPTGCLSAYECSLLWSWDDQRCCGTIGVRLAMNQRYGCAAEANVKTTWSEPCWATLVSGPPSAFQSAFRSIALSAFIALNV